ncbi:transposase [Glaciecola sp. 1036]|uniref:transposase n=1 Tax=Alteromonadaceae TaxID=72275 RepID=UPI003CFF0615
MSTLADVFAIDVLSYSIMHNHTHQVLHVNVEKALALSDVEVLKRWSFIGKLDKLCKQYLNPEARIKLDEFQIAHVLDCVDKFRSQMTSISCYMRYLNEHIAKKANKEDGCKGHFWDGRFKSQAILDIETLFHCMAYVDLNPVRAGFETSFHEAKFTGVFHRLYKQPQQKTLLPLFTANLECLEKIISKVTLTEYIAILLEKSAKIKSEKGVPSSDPSLNFEKIYGNVAGREEKVDKFLAKMKSRRAKKSPPH